MQQLKPKQKEEYKETGLGYLPENWKVVGFENAILKKRIKIGKIKQQEYKEIGKYPVIDQSQKYIAGHTDEKDKLYQAFLPVIIFGDHTRIFKFVDFPFVAGADGIKVILPDSRKFDSKFFYYGMLELKIASRGYNRHYPLLREKKIPLPPLPEQKKIVAVLSVVQETKEKTEAVIEAAREVKKSLMKYLFTYGPVPVEEMENVSLKETEIGLIPEGWEVVRLRDMAKIEYGKANPKDRGSVPVVGSGGIYSHTRKPLVELPTIVIGRKGTAGKAWIFLEPCYPSDTTFYLKWKRDMDILFLFNYMVLNPLSGEHAKTTLPSIQKRDLEDYLIPLPPFSEQRKIAEILSIVDEKIETEENEKKALEELFRTLLNNLMTAKIRVNHLRIAV